MEREPSLQEFKRQIEDGFKKLDSWNLTPEQIYDYLYADDYIEHKYYKELELYNKRELTYRQLMEGVPAILNSTIRC